MTAFKGKILIVDDEAATRDTLESLLIRESYEMYFAVNGFEALNCINQVNPDVILLDVMMPGMDGFEVCQKIKSDKRWRHIPIILITALDSRENLERGIDAGADDFLQKPLNSIELRARIRSLLRIKKQFDELEANMRTREDLAYMIVHDMNNPLMVISGYTEILRTYTNEPEELGHIETIIYATEQLKSFINEILIIAKMETNGFKLNLSDVDVNQLVMSVKRNQNIIAKSKNIDLTVEIPQKIPKILLDGNLFRRVLDNLVSNALKFAPSESSVIIRVESQDRRLIIKVLDQGPGIPEEYKDSIFEKFKIADMKKKGVQQTGLGLAFCKMVVEAHGGKIYVSPNQPNGSIFTVEALT